MDLCSLVSLILHKMFRVHHLSKNIERRVVDRFAATRTKIAPGVVRAVNTWNKWMEIGKIILSTLPCFMINFIDSQNEE